MFVNAPPGRPEAAFVILNDPVQYQDSIQKLVRSGYLVRTRADEGTKEARQGDYRRLEAALSSGAQFISTDCYLPDERFRTHYQVQLSGKGVARCNPVNKPAQCTNASLSLRYCRLRPSVLTFLRIPASCRTTSGWAAATFVFSPTSCFRL